MIKGSCNCGAVAFEIATAPKDVYICHCSICRKWTGNNGVAVVIVANEAFRWVKGEDNRATWRKPDGDWQSSFCKTCGSALPGPNSETQMFVPAGLLDTAQEDLRVAAHIWVGSKARWDEIGDDACQYQRAFGDEG